MEKLERRYARRRLALAAAHARANATIEALREQVGKILLYRMDILGFLAYTSIDLMELLPYTYVHANLRFRKQMHVW